MIDDGSVVGLLRIMGICFERFSDSDFIISSLFRVNNVV